MSTTKSPLHLRDIFFSSVANTPALWTALECAGNGFFIWDYSAGLDLWASQSFWQQLGYATLAGIIEPLPNWEDVIYLEDMPIGEELEQELAQKISAQSIIRFKHSDSSSLWFVVQFILFTDEKTSKKYFFAGCNEVSESKYQELELRRQLQYHDNLLVKKHNRLQQILEQTGEIVFVMNNKREIIEFYKKDSAREGILSQWERQFYLGRTVEESGFPENLSNDIAFALLSLQAGKSEVHIDYQEYDIRGNTEWFEALITPFTEENLLSNEEAEYLCVIRNITERKNLALRLEKNNLLLSNIYKQIPGVIFQYRSYADGRLSFPFATEGVKDMFDVSPDELLFDGELIFKHVLPEDIKSIAESMEKHRISLEIWNNEFRIQHPEKGLRYYRTTARPSEQEDGTVLWYGYCEDRTKQKVAEEELRSNKAFYELLVEQVADYLWLFDLDEKTIVFSSPSVTELLGYSVDETTDAPFSFLFTNDSLQDLLQKFPKQTAEFREVTDKQFSPRYLEVVHMKHKDGSIVSMEMIYSLTENYISKHIGAVGVARDITDRLRKEQELQQTKETLEILNASLEDKVHQRTKEIETANIHLQKLNKEKDKLLAMASHDLKNPLSSIAVRTELIHNKLRKFVPEHANKFDSDIESIIRVARNMSSMIEEFLNLNAIESGGYKLNRSPISIAETINNILNDNRDKASKKDIILREHIDCQNTAVIDRTSFTQIIDNLLSNAIKFSESGKQVTVHCTTTQQQIIITIEDEGPGISCEEQDKLYEAFSKLSPRPTGGESSTGLGLSIVKQLVDLNGGTISCSSKLGVGTTFTVILPLTHTHK